MVNEQISSPFKMGGEVRYLKDGSNVGPTIFLMLTMLSLSGSLHEGKDKCLW